MARSPSWTDSFCLEIIILWPWQQWSLIHSITAKHRSECHPQGHHAIRRHILGQLHFSVLRAVLEVSRVLCECEEGGLHVRRRWGFAVRVPSPALTFVLMWSLLLDSLSVVTGTLVKDCGTPTYFAIMHY